jgi:hypothetical protein
VSTQPNHYEGSSLVNTPNQGSITVRNHIQTNARVNLDQRLRGLETRDIEQEARERERRREYQHSYYQRNRELLIAKRLAKRRARRAAEPPKPPRRHSKYPPGTTLKERARLYYLANRERITLYREANRERIRERWQRYYRANTERIKAKVRECQKRRRAAKGVQS